MDSIFSVKNVNLYYGDKHVLKDVNLEIYEKQVTAFIGPSGCGKSTLLRCLDRMNDLIDDCKVEGEILYKGKDVKNYDAMDLRSNVGMVFQTPNPFPMSIFDNVAYGPRCHGIKNKKVLKEIVEEALKKAALYDEVKDNLKESGLALSGGQQQRLCIARMQQATRVSDYTAFFMLGEIVEYNKTGELFKSPKNKKTEDYITGRFG